MIKHAENHLHNCIIKIMNCVRHDDPNLAKAMLKRQLAERNLKLLKSGYELVKN